MLRIEKLGQFAAQLLDLLVRHDADARQVAVLVVERDLIVRQPILFPLLPRHGQIEQTAEGLVSSRKICGHDKLSGKFGHHRRSQPGRTGLQVNHERLRCTLRRR